MKEDKYCEHLKLSLKNLYSKISNKWGNKTAFFTISSLFVFVLISLSLTIDFPNDSYINGLRVEAGGFLLDILLFGILLGVYDFYKTKQQKIEQYQDELEDYRGWTEKEASYRIFGNMKRLYKLGITDYNLERCYFKDIEFRMVDTFGMDFKNSSLYGAIFEDCILKYANFSLLKDNRPTDTFEYTFLYETIFSNCNLDNSKFIKNYYDHIKFYNKTKMGYCHFEESEFVACIFSRCDVMKSSFINVKFVNCNFQEIDFSKAVIKDMQFINCNLEGCIINEGMVFDEDTIVTEYFDINSLQRKN